MYEKERRKGRLREIAGKNILFIIKKKVIEHLKIYNIYNHVSISIEI